MQQRLMDGRVTHTAMAPAQTAMPTCMLRSLSPLVLERFSFLSALASRPLSFFPMAAGGSAGSAAGGVRGLSFRRLVIYKV